MSTRFRNDHLSFSRLQRFEQCPLRFKLHYIDQKQAEPGVPLRFGKAVHAVLETLVREHMEQEREGPLSEERAVELWQEAWSAGELSGIAVFEEGLGILRSFVRRQGHLDHQDVLAIERRFELTVGPFVVLGFIDRVDRVDDETIEVIDYKTNRMLFTREEVDTSLQMSLYELAVRQLWPWAKKVRLTFDMLRHDLRMTTARTEEQLTGALAYVETMGRMTEEAREFPPRLNPNCVYCDHRQHCPTYASALRGERTVVCEDLGDLEHVAREREEVARLSKILYARKQELEDVLKAHLEAHDELVLAGVRYRMFNAASKSYPLARTLDVLAQATGEDRGDLALRLSSIDNKALDAVLKALGKTLGKDRVNLLKAELDTVVERRFSQRFWAIVEQFDSLPLEDFQQELECRFVDESYSFYSYDLILPNTREDLELCDDFTDLPFPEGRLVAGFDVGRSHDRSELALFEEVGGRFVCRLLRSYDRVPFAEQEADLVRMMNTLPVARLSIDKSGIGMNLAENLGRAYPQVVGEAFTNASKERWCTDFKILLQRRDVDLPRDRELVAQLHSIKRRVMPSGNVSYDAERTNRGHANRFWALVLACQKERGQARGGEAEVGVRVIG